MCDNILEKEEIPFKMSYQITARDKADKKTQ